MTGKKRGTEQPESQKVCGYCVSASCRLTPSVEYPIATGAMGNIWAPLEDETAGHHICGEGPVTNYVMAAFMLQITKFTSKELSLVSEK